MVSPRIWWLCLCLWLPGLALAATEFSASVDRKQLTEQDTFSLQLRFHQQVMSGQPDFSPLQKDFEVLNTRRSNQFRMVNGQSESYTEWQLRLMPKRTGQLMIPAISFRGSRTTPINISVSPLSEAVRQQKAKDVFFHVEISNGPYPVQGQILYIEKLYYRQNHENASLSELKVTDARVEPLGDVRQYTTVIDGERLGVYERRYAIFPEQSGELVIPGQRFRARLINPYNRWDRGQEVSAVSRLIRLTVEPMDDAYPQAPWLPARQLTIMETLSSQQWQVGEPVTRTFMVTADGLSGSQIPALAMPEVDGLRYYPDQNQHQDSVGDKGITGTLTQSLAIVPTQAGQLTLPEIRVPWWNMRSQQLEYATVPARTIDVAPAANSAQNSTPSSAPSNAQASGQNNQIPAPAQPIAATSATPAWWPWLTLASGVMNLLLIAVIAWLWRRQPAATKPTAQATPEISTEPLKQACRSGDPARIRTAVIAWAKQQPTLQGCHNLQQLAQRIDQPELSRALAELDHTLYSASGNSAYQAEPLWQLLRRWQPNDQINNNGELKPLYP
ncbi:hypothetical protein GCM10011297_05830 [Bacterioplanes sanyensis]|uniref:BatD family protein n=1 Tax=Bacterioplanes sanyensis TaxID=1249553 RepID=UPI0016762700|nr:BatD family protein [Bacterioplanes sanyensis]GGY35512.1 hypothetical protein GCM10011297_05830 [Bacterioplanes sanyensis]